MMKMEIIGLDKLLNGFEEIKRKRKANLQKALKVSAYLVQGTARKKILRDAKTGRSYGNHIASAPGEAPANDTGNLASNISVVIDSGTDEATVIAKTPYAAALEFGSYRKIGKGKAVYTAPRPFLGPSLDQNFPEIKLIITRALIA